MEENEGKKVNLHRVINLKKELKDEMKEKKKLIKQSLLTQLEQDKDKHLKLHKNEDKGKYGKFDKKLGKN